MTTDLPAETIAALERLAPAEIVVAATACTTADDVGRVVAAVEEAGRRSTARAVLLVPDTLGSDLEGLGAGANSPVQFVPCRLPSFGRGPFSTSEIGDLFRPIAAIAARASARACTVLGTCAEAISADAVSALGAPVLDRQIDLVCPIYPRPRLDGLINTGVVYPLTRALYGLRVAGQLGTDFGFSTRFVEAMAASHHLRGPGRPLWLVTEAVERGFQIAEAHLAHWRPPAETATDASGALAQVLGPLFVDMELHAATWQRARGSQPVATFGQRAADPDPPHPVDVREMIESFTIGLRNLQDVWGRLLPPASQIELKPLARVDADRFRMPDRLWARIVYDFALGHRLRTINRDHLIRAMTPLYLGWVASFVSEVATVDRVAAADRVERLCTTYEAEKPYLVARWRWPDRFNP